MTKSIAIAAQGERRRRLEALVVVPPNDCALRFAPGFEALVRRRLSTDLSPEPSTGAVDDVRRVVRDDGLAPGIRASGACLGSGFRVRALSPGVATFAVPARLRRGAAVARASSRRSLETWRGFACSDAGRGRHSTRSLPICWTGAQSSASAMRVNSDSRSYRSSLNTRTLMSSCAVSATSIS